MITTQSQMHRTDKYSRRSSIIQKYLASLAKWLSVRLRTMWSQVRVPLLSQTKVSIPVFSAKKLFLKFWENFRKVLLKKQTFNFTKRTLLHKHISRILSIFERIFEYLNFMSGFYRNVFSIIILSSFKVSRYTATY